LVEEELGLGMPVFGICLGAQIIARVLGATVRCNPGGVQFHPEVDPTIVQEWCALDERCGDQRELTHQPDPFFRAAELRALAKRLIDRRTARIPCI
jgi:GMP synthase-like glutamine amidotransferase